MQLRMHDAEHVCFAAIEHSIAAVRIAVERGLLLPPLNNPVCRDWKPFFGKELPARELATLQHTPVYQDLSAQFYQLLEGRVEETVRDAISRE